MLKRRGRMVDANQQIVSRSLKKNVFWEYSKSIASVYLLRKHPC